MTFEFTDILLYNKRLHSFYFRTADKASSDALLAAFKTLYGDGQQLDFSNNFKWVGDRVVLLFRENVLSGKADVRVISKAMEKRFSKKWRQYNRQW